MSHISIANVRIFDGNGLTDFSTVIVEDGTIAAIHPTTPEDLQQDGAIDGTGGTLLPGLIDAHMHLTDRSTLDALAAQGVTTGFDMASWPAERAQRLRHMPGTADLLSAGLPFIGPAGPHSHFVPAEAIVLDADRVPAEVDRRIADGADYIKVVTEAPGRGGPEPAIVRAVVEAAHAAGTKVVAHASHIDAFELSLDAGADMITHVPTETAVSPATAARMAREGRIAIPTLTVSELLTRAMPRPGSTYATARDSVVALREAGVPVLAGTDAVEQPGAPFSVPIGSTLHHELELLVDAGYSPVEALRSATSLPAHWFELVDRGAIRPGLRADLLLIDGDPTTDIAATRTIIGVWIRGERVAGAGR